MAAAVANGRVEMSEKINTLKLRECSEKEEKIYNGKLENHNNGYKKSAHLTNGVTVSRF